MTPFDYSELSLRLWGNLRRGFNPSSTACWNSAWSNKNRQMARVYEARDDIAASAVQSALTAPSIYDEALALLARRGFAGAERQTRARFSPEPYAADPQVMEAWRQVYRDAEKHWDIYELAEKLVDLEYRFHLWRFSHMKTVERTHRIEARERAAHPASIISKRRSICASYPELWDVRTGNLICCRYQRTGVDLT